MKHLAFSPCFSFFRKKEKQGKKGKMFYLAGPQQLFIWPRVAFEVISGMASEVISGF